MPTSQLGMTRMTRSNHTARLYDTARQKQHEPLFAAAHARISIQAGDALVQSRLTGILPGSMMELRSMPGEQAWTAAPTVDLDKENAGTPSKQGAWREGPIKSPASVCVCACREGAAMSATFAVQLSCLAPLQSPGVWLTRF